nr:cytochrome c oxidase subunit II [Sphingomonas sp.]
MSDRGGVPALALPLVGGCSYQSYQSTFSDAAVEVRQFNSLFVIFLMVCAVMYLLVIGFMLAAIMRRRAGSANVTEERRHRESDPLMRVGLIAWGSLVGVGLIGLAVASFFGDRSMARASADPKLAITITANQWWWDVRYSASDNSKMIRTANELHLPAGVPVHIYLKTNDVIHSFWVPSLAGKQDLIPGRVNDITITPTRVGIYRGQCAEFCGAQHAHMALIVDVESNPNFVRWWEQQLRPAPAPATALARAGYDFVTSRNCGACHNIGGTPANGSVGPDLTHLAGRRTLAAGTMPMSEGNLYGWVADPQSLKGGNHMPTIGLEPDQLHAVVAYLETLK